MTCGRARRLLWPDCGARSTSLEIVEAQEHLASCDSCQEFVREIRAVADMIRATAPRVEAPAEARERLFTALARARAGSHTVSRRWAVPRRLAVAVAAILVVFGGLSLSGRLSRSGRSPDPITALAEDHMRARSDAGIASSDAAEVARWLAGQLDFAMHVPVLPDASIRGARLCHMDGRRGAVVEYQVGDKVVSYFVVPDGSGSVDEGRPSGFDRATRAGYHVVSWREPGLLHAMVGNLPESQLATLAKACVEQAQRAVAWLGGRVRSQEG